MSKDKDEIDSFVQEFNEMPSDQRSHVMDNLEAHKRMIEIHENGKKLGIQQAYWKVTASVAVMALFAKLVGWW